MTREGQGIDPEDMPFPPASTRWSEPTSHQDEGLLPPFVPRRPRSDAESGDAPPVTTTPPDDSLDHEDVQADDEPFPFETPWDGGADVAEPEVDLAELEQRFEAATPAVPGVGWDTGPEAHQKAGPDVDRSAAGPAPAAELAERLEGLAARLRAGGWESVEADMASPDRLTALLAGLIAGYLAGRDS
jgi:hypothetical protein